MPVFKKEIGRSVTLIFNTVIIYNVCLGIFRKRVIHNECLVPIVHNPTFYNLSLQKNLFRIRLFKMISQ
jgi:hypothetical protein